MPCIFCHSPPPPPSCRNIEKRGDREPEPEPILFGKWIRCPVFPPHYDIVVSCDTGHRRQETGEVSTQPPVPAEPTADRWCAAVALASAAGLSPLLGQRLLLIDFWRSTVVHITTAAVFTTIHDCCVAGFEKCFAGLERDRRHGLVLASIFDHQRLSVWRRQLRFVGFVYSVLPLCYSGLHQHLPGKTK